MKLIFTFFLLLVATIAFSQKQITTFYKNNGSRVTVRDSADYIRVVREPDSGSTYYKVMEYYLNGKPKALGQSSSIMPLKMEGAYVTYHANGNKSSELNYRADILTGVQYYYYPNGKLQETRTYSSVVAKNENPFKRPYLITTLNDTAGTALITNGNGKYMLYDKKLAKITTEGMVKNGLKDGEWKMTVGKDSILITEIYNNGTLKTGTSKFANGESYTYTEPDKLPEFKGGVQGFYQFLSKNIRYPAEAQRNTIQGQVTLTFIVEKDGKLTGIKQVGKSPSELLTAEAIRVLNKSPKWQPGVQYGRVVRVIYTVPIVFAL